MVVRRIRQIRTQLSGDGRGAFLIRAVAGSGAVRIAGTAASFAVGVLLARLLGTEGYGYYGLALSIVTILGIPGELGIPSVVMREAAAAGARHDAPMLIGVLRWARRAVLGLSLAMAAIAAGVAFCVAVFDRSILAIAILCGAPAIPLMALARVHAAALQGLHDVVRGQIPSELLRPALIAAALLIAFAFGVHVGAAGAMALYSVTAAAVFVLAFVWLRRRLPNHGPAAPVCNGRKLFASSVPMALTDGMRMVQSELSIILVGAVVAPAAVGLFRIAVVTANMAAIAIAIAGQVALPVIARLYAEGDHARLQKTVTAFGAIQFAGVAALALPLIALPNMLIGLVFGEAFVPASTALVILAAGQLGNAAFGPNAILLNMTHHERRVTRAMGIAAAMNLVLVPLFTMLWGIVGAAVALVLALLSWNVIAWIDARRLLGIETSAVRALWGDLHG